MSRTLGLVIGGAAVVALVVAGLALALGGGKSTAPQTVTSTVSKKVEHAPVTPTRAPARPRPAADQSDPTGDDRSDEGSDNEGSDNQAGDNRGGNQP